MLVDNQNLFFPEVLYNDNIVYVSDTEYPYRNTGEMNFHGRLIVQILQRNLSGNPIYQLAIRIVELNEAREFDIPFVDARDNHQAVIGQELIRKNREIQISGYTKPTDSRFTLTELPHIIQHQGDEIIDLHIPYTVPVEESPWNEAYECCIQNSAVLFWGLDSDEMRRLLRQISTCRKVTLIVPATLNTLSRVISFLGSIPLMPPAVLFYLGFELTSFFHYCIKGETLGRRLGWSKKQAVTYFTGAPMSLTLALPFGVAGMATRNCILGKRACKDQTKFIHQNFKLGSLGAALGCVIYFVFLSTFFSINK